MMDDPISALDANVRKAIFKQVFQRLLKDKTRILVTHAVDFVHLADKIVIMEDGKIKAKGTFEELATNEYMIQILDIHKKHKKENQAVADGKHTSVDAADLVDQLEEAEAEVSVQEDSDHEDMLEVELDEKLKVFRGKKDEKNLVEDSGKLMEDEDKEDVHVNSSTYGKVIAMAGGKPFVALLVASQLLLESFGGWSNSVRNTWATESEDKQHEMFFYYMKWIVGITSFSAIFIFIKVYLLAKMNLDMSKGFHSDIMTKVMNAPVNTFFNVTPVGKILVRFSKDLDVFQGALFWSISHIMNMAFRVTMVVFFLVYACPVNVVFIGILFALFRQILTPYLSADN